MENNVDVKANASNNEVMHSFTDNQNSSSPLKAIIILAVVLLLGIGSGYGLAQFLTPSNTSILPSSLDPNAPQKGKVVGSNDTKTFKDIAEGTLKEGGIEGEGQFHLERPGGPSQNVYLTSSFVDLSQFVNRKIKVWGETQKAQTAGWLMDVGRVEVQ